MQCRADKEPIGLEPGGRDVEIERCPGLVPNAVVIAGNYMELVRSRAKLGVVRLTACAYVLPFVIDAIQLVAKEHALGNGKAQSGVVNFQILVCGQEEREDSNPPYVFRLR
jgi:hypothetical protein